MALEGHLNLAKSMQWHILPKFGSNSKIELKRLKQMARGTVESNKIKEAATVGCLTDKNARWQNNQNQDINTGYSVRNRQGGPTKCQFKQLCLLTTHRPTISIRERAKNTCFIVPSPDLSWSTRVQAAPTPVFLLNSQVLIVSELKTLLVANYKYLNTEMDFLMRLYCCQKALMGFICLLFRRHLQRVYRKWTSLKSCLCFSWVHNGREL